MLFDSLTLLCLVCLLGSVPSTAARSAATLPWLACGRSAYAAGGTLNVCNNVSSINSL